MKKSVLCFFILCNVIFSSVFSDIPKQSSKIDNIDSPDLISEKIAILKSLVDENVILTFLAHQKTMEFFLKEKQRRAKYFLSIKLEMEKLQKQFSSDHVLTKFINCIFSQIYLIENPFPYEEIVIPFLTCGLMNFHGIEDPQLIRKIHVLQVKLFRNYLWEAKDIEYWKKVDGEGDIDLMEEIKNFSQDCPLPIFSKIIYPLLQGLTEIEDIGYFYDGKKPLEKEIFSKVIYPPLQNLLKRDMETDDMDSFQYGNDRESLIAGQQIELKEIWNPPSDFWQSIKCFQKFAEMVLFPLFDKTAELNCIQDEMNAQNWEDLKKTSPCGYECVCFSILNKIEQDFRKQNFFSLDKFMGVFFEILTESCPEYKDFFGDLQYKNENGRSTF